jgi:hypothetical protein
MVIGFCCLSPTRALWSRGDPRQGVAVFSLSLLLQLAGGAYLSYYVVHILTVSQPDNRPRGAYDGERAKKVF